MAYWSHVSLLEEAWDCFLNEISADIFFFQEGQPLEKIKDDSRHLAWSEIGGSRRWGSGVYSKKYEITEEMIDTSFRGAFTIANATIADTRFTLISLYGLMESDGPCKGYSIANLHRMLSDLTGILSGHISGKRNIILGGDLNASVQFDPGQGNNSHGIFFDRLEDFGLTDCFKLAEMRPPIQTLRHGNSMIPWQNDYLFISKSLSTKFINCGVIDTDLVKKCSDHNPVVIILDL